MTPKIILTKEFLEQEYIKKQKSIQQIAQENNIKSPNSITQFLKKYNLVRKTKTQTIEEICTKDYLYHEYIINQKSLKEIGLEIGKSKTVIRRLLIKYQIPKRKQSKYSNSCVKHYYKRRTHHEITGKYWANLKHGAKARNLVFNITIDYAWQLFLDQNRKCALSGLDLVFYQPGNKFTDTTASLDRIDSSKGYIIGNIQWVYKKINYLKMNMPQEEFIQLCKLVANHN